MNAMQRAAAKDVGEVVSSSAEDRGANGSPPRRLLRSFLLLCVLGVAVSIELTRIHVFVHTDPSYHSVCALSEGVNCETVAASPYSVFAGLPVSVWGIAGYVVMGVLALWAHGKRRLHAAWPLGILVMLAAFSAVTSAILGFVSATRISSLCLFCMASYAINAGLLALGLVAWRRTRLRWTELLWNDLRALATRPALLAALVFVGAATLVGMRVFVPSYWRTPGWSHLAKLASGEDGGLHWIGARSPKVTVVELSDYECPHCRAAHEAMRILAAKHPDQIRLVHRHLPLDMACNPGVRRPFHGRACLFAEAAECAGLQGRFWEMNDALFSVQETVKAKDVDPVELAVRIGLNRSDFKRCLESHATAERVAADVREGLARNLKGTPSFLVGERLFMGRIPEEELAQLLGAAP